MRGSIVTVSFNEAATIAGTLASVAVPSQPDKEQPILDGGSTGETPTIGVRYARAAKLVAEPGRGLGRHDEMDNSRRPNGGPTGRVKMLKRYLNMTLQFLGKS